MSWRVRRHLLDALREDHAFREVCRRAYRVAEGNEQIAAELVLEWVDKTAAFRDRLERIALQRTAADVAREMTQTTMLDVRAAPPRAVPRDDHIAAEEIA